MIPKLIIGQAIIYAGNNLEVLPELASNSVDSIVCDPPYELGFMGKSWDNSGIAYSVELWRECLRVLKPGGHLLAFGGTRTWHRLAVAIEDAGFEIRDNIAWLYGSGFPKSLNIAKSIEAKLTTGSGNKTAFKKLAGEQVERGNWGINSSGMVQNYRPSNYDETAGATRLGKLEATTDEAKQWDGWGTALKPAHEPIVVARKPLIGTVAQNVMKYGTGGINVDATRIGYVSEQDRASATPQGQPRNHEYFGKQGQEAPRNDNTKGRFPANIILDETTAELLDEQTATLKGATSRTERTNPAPFTPHGTSTGELIPSSVYGDSGGASRFFYVAKASKRDRNEGLDELPEVRHADRNSTDGVGGDNPRNRTNQAKQNFHPTVKPTALMQYLVRLVTPEGGTVLDPFTGSGSTGKAAILEGKQFIGIELTEEYLPIIAGRLEHAINTSEKQEGDDLFADL
jgi:site-specific DNA-methyltransferase (adenine-specific)